MATNIELAAGNPLARFLCPFAQATGHAPDYAAAAASGGNGRAAAYDAFIDKIIAAARAMPSQRPAPGIFASGGSASRRFRRPNFR